MSGATKCPWCGREVVWHKDRLPRHVQSRHVQCVGSGQPRHQIEAHALLSAEVRAENARLPRFRECWVMVDGAVVMFVGQAGTRKGWQSADGIVTSKALHVMRPAHKDETLRFLDALGRTP